MPGARVAGCGLPSIVRGRTKISVKLSTHFSIVYGILLEDYIISQVFLGLK